MPVAFFAAFVGQLSRAREFSDLFTLHAASLGMKTHLGRRVLSDGRVIDWCKASAGDEDGVAYDAGSGERFLTIGSDEAHQSTATFDVVEQSLRAVVPFASPDHLYVQRGEGEWLVGNDLRLHRRWKRASISPLGVLAMLQHGEIPAPYTIYEGVERVPSGHAMRLDKDGHLSLTCDVASPEVREIDQATADEQLSTKLGEILGAAQKRSVVYFSGGVDSALIALRLRQAGHDDVTLVHYSFGADDPETRVARDMAAALGFPLHVVTFSMEAIPRVLERVHRDYSRPFGDYSAITMNILAHESLPHMPANGTVVDGTGADGCFSIGMRFGEWDNVVRVPQFIRRAVASGLAPFELWNRPGRLELAWRVSTRSVQHSLPRAAITAQNSFEGVAFHTPAAIARAIESAFSEGVDRVGAGLSGERRFVLLDLAHVCAGQYAAKAFDIVKQAGRRPLFPFLDPRMIQFSLALPSHVKATRKERKAILKRLLAKAVPPSLVYRTKSGFVPPLASMLAEKPMRDRLMAVVDRRANPLLEHCSARFLEDLVRRVQHRMPVSTASLNYLWVHLFVATWLTQS